MHGPVSSGLLKVTLAQALHLPERKIDYPHRALQEAGMVSRGKRGRGGAGVTTRDAASTLVSVACSFIGDEVLKSVLDFSSMPMVHTSYKAERSEDWVEVVGGSWQSKGFRIPRLQELPAGHSFIDALTAVIESARDDDFTAAIRDAYPNAADAFHTIDVTFGGPNPSGSIAIRLYALGAVYLEEAAYFFEGRGTDPKAGSAFSVHVTVDFHPIYALAKLFRRSGDVEEQS